MSNNNPNNEKKKALLAFKDKLLEEIQYYEKSIDDFRANHKNNSYYEDGDSTDSEDYLPTAVDLGPDVGQLKQQQAMLQTCLQATQELTGVTVLQSEVNVLVEDPQLQNERPVSEAGTWKEVTAECRVDLVPFTITFYMHIPDRKFGPISYRGLQVSLVKSSHEIELNKSVLHTLKRPSDAVEVVRSYAFAYRSRRTTLARLANKYGTTLFMEPRPEGGFILKCANLLEISWRLENKWSPVAPFHHKMKFDLEYMDESYIKIITTAHKQLLDPSIETDERTLLLSKIITTCLQARGPVDSESDLESRQTETQAENEPKTDNEVMAPPKSLPKKTKKLAQKRSVDDGNTENAKKIKVSENIEGRKGKENNLQADRVENVKKIKDNNNIEAKKKGKDEGIKKTNNLETNNTEGAKKIKVANNSDDKNKGKDKDTDVVNKKTKNNIELKKKSNENFDVNKNTKSNVGKSNDNELNKENNNFINKNTNKKNDNSNVPRKRKIDDNIQIEDKTDNKGPKKSKSNDEIKRKNVANDEVVLKKAKSSDNFGKNNKQINENGPKKPKNTNIPKVAKNHEKIINNEDSGNNNLNNEPKKSKNNNMPKEAVKKSKKTIENVETNIIDKNNEEITKISVENNKTYNLDGPNKVKNNKITENTTKSKKTIDNVEKHVKIAKNINSADKGTKKPKQAIENENLGDINNVDEIENLPKNFKINNIDKTKKKATDNVNNIDSDNKLENTNKEKYIKTTESDNNNPKDKNEKSKKAEVPAKKVDKKTKMSMANDKKFDIITKKIENNGNIKTKNLEKNTVNNVVTSKNSIGNGNSDKNNEITTNNKDSEIKKSKSTSTTKNKESSQKTTEVVKKSSEIIKPKNTGNTKDNQTMKKVTEKNANTIKSKERITNINKVPEKTVKDIPTINKETPSTNEMPKKDINNKKITKISIKTVRNLNHRSPSKNVLKVQNPPKTGNTKLSSGNTKMFAGNTEKENGGKMSKIPQKKMASSEHLKANFLRVSPRRLPSLNSLSQDSSTKNMIKNTNIPRLLKKPAPKN